MENYLQQILTLFKNVVLNSVGSKRTFLELMEAGDVARAVEMMDGHDDEVDNAVAGMTAAIEPALIIVLAVVVGTIVIAMFLPMIKIISSVSGGAS